MQRLIRVAGGVASELWRGPAPPRTDEDTPVVIEVIGARIRAWWSGALACDVEDRRCPRGRAGLLSVAGTGASWSVLRAAEAVPAWERWHTFGDEATHASGRRITVMAGRDLDPAPAPSAGESQRFIGRAPGSRPSFRARGLDLRLVAPDGSPDHSSRFLPDAMFAPVGAPRVLRAADGTGLALLILDAAGAVRLDAGTYRLRLTFRRDNRAQVPDALVLSQDGETADEVAAIDLPWS